MEVAHVKWDNNASSTIRRQLMSLKSKNRGLLNADLPGMAASYGE